MRLRNGVFSAAVAALAVVLTMSACGSSGSKTNNNANDATKKLANTFTVDWNPQPRDKIKDGGTVTIPVTEIPSQENSMAVGTTTASAAIWYWYNPQLTFLIVIAAIVVVTLLVIWRPLMFSSVDPDVAAAAGVPVRTLALVFMLALGLATAVSVQIVGALLVLSLLVTPAAAALRLSSHPVVVPILSTVFAVVSVVGGILTLPTTERLASGNDLDWKSTTHLVTRAVGRFMRAGGRNTEGDAGHLLEGIAVVAFDRETGAVEIGLPPEGSGLRWTEFVEKFADAYQARFGEI